MFISSLLPPYFFCFFFFALILSSVNSQLLIIAMIGIVFASLCPEYRIICVASIAIHDRHHNIHKNDINSPEALFLNSSTLPDHSMLLSTSAPSFCEARIQRFPYSLIILCQRICSPFIEFSDTSFCFHVYPHPDLF